MKNTFLQKIYNIEGDEVELSGILGNGLSVWESKKLPKYYIVNEMDEVVCMFYADEPIDCIFFDNKNVR